MRQRQPKVHIYYHKCDMDGQSSGYLMKWAIENGIINFPFKNHQVVLVPFNYGFFIKDEMIQKEDVLILLDISFPKDDMLRLYKTVDKKMIWIDHHITVIEEMQKENFQPLCNCSDEFAACKLTLNWIKSNLSKKGKDLTSVFWSNLTKFIDYLDTYDRFDKQSELWEVAYTINFVFPAFETDPITMGGDAFWEMILTACEEGEIEEDINDFYEKGKIVRSVMESNNSQLINSYGFVAKFEGLNIYFVNRGIGGSYVFDNHFDPTIHDAVCCFIYTKKAQFSMSFYTTKEGIDLTPIFEKFNGGGHKGAGGIKVKSLDFDPVKKILTVKSL